MVLEHSDSVKSRTKQFRDYVSARVFKEEGRRTRQPAEGRREGKEGRDGLKEVKDGRKEGSSLGNNASTAKLLKVIVKKRTGGKFFHINPKSLWIRIRNFF